MLNMINFTVTDAFQWLVLVTSVKLGECFSQNVRFALKCV